MSSIEDILVSAQSGSQELQQRSLNFLLQELRTNPGNLFLILSEILSSSSKPLLPRRISGIYIKNLLNNSTKDPNFQDIWTFLPGNAKQGVKTTILAMLADDSRDLRQVSAQIIAEISRYELPSHQWPELIEILLKNSMNINPVFKEAALMALGYICELAETETFNKEQADSILTVFNSGLSDGEANPVIIKASINGFKNSLRFFRENFMNAVERNLIMNTLYKLFLNSRVEIRREVMGIFVDIAGIYYDLMENHLIDLGNITYAAINNDDLQVAILAVEFWNVLGQVEVERMELRQAHKGYLITAAATLTPILLSKIHMYEEDDDISLNKSCCYTLKNIAEICKDPIVDIVYTYISVNLTNSNLKLMKSAALVFGSIMKGPSVESLSHLVRSSTSTLKKLLSNPSYNIRLAVAWCIWNILSNIESLASFFNKSDLFQIVITMLNDQQEIPSHGCTCLNIIIMDPDIMENLSREMVEELFELLSRLICDKANASSQINALIVTPGLINKAPKFCGIFFENKLSGFLELLENSPPALNSYFLLVIEAIYTIMGKASLKEHLCDKVVGNVLRIIESNKMAFEAALDVIGIISEKLEKRFEKYMEHVVPILMWGLDDILASEKCKASVMCVGDLARSLYLKFIQYIPNFIPRFSLILTEDSVNLQVKIETINTLGDICAIPGVYSKYSQTIIQYIDSASSICRKLVIEEENPDFFDAVNLLRGTVLCFYVNLVIGLKEAKSTALLIGKLEEIVNLCLILTQPNYKSSHDTHYYATGLLGDIATAFTESSAYVLKSQSVYDFLMRSRQHTLKEIRELANQSLNRINNL